MHFARFIDSIRYEHDASLVNRWPEADPLRLRMCAMIGVGTMGIAADRWSVEGSDRRLLGYLDDGFKMIDTEREEAAASLKGKRARARLHSPASAINGMADGEENFIR